LTSTLKVLLAGPLPAEVKQGLITMLSQDISLRSVSVKGNTAYLDFNESFRFNSLGKEGLEAQLKQIVYSVTEFSNIENVQILIEANRSEYLGPEGIYIGTPLSRDSFPP
jgi:spore germination protein GerM